MIKEFNYRPHQVEAADAVEAAWQSGIKRTVMDMCVGSGKSHTYGLIGKREIERGGRVLTVAPTRELVGQIAKAGTELGITVGINSAALGERTWRGPMISASIQSVYNFANSFGPITLLQEDEAHLSQFGSSGMLQTLRRGLGDIRINGGTGTPWRTQGGPIVDGEGAPYDRIVYRYGIVDGIRDGYLVAPYSATLDDTMDASKLAVVQGDYTGASQDKQMIAAIDQHIPQMLHYGRERRSWLVFEASRKAAIAMHKRMNEWGIPTGLVLGDRTKADALNRYNTVEALRSGRIRAIVNVECLTTGFDVQEIDMLVCRRRTKSLSLWIQIVGRLLRTVGGNIEESIRRGKADGLLLDFSGNCEEFGPLDFIRPKESKVAFVSCDCSARVPVAAMRCWSCDEPMTKLCPACLEPVQKGVLDCPSCNYDMRTGGGDTERKPQALLETPSGAALISSFAKNVDREGGWAAVRKGYSTGEVDTASERHSLPATLLPFADKAKWLRVVDGEVVGILIPNGLSRTSVLQVGVDGRSMVVPMPSLVV
jgi:DNA repair protein RadD